MNLPIELYDKMISLGIKNANYDIIFNYLNDTHNIKVEFQYLKGDTYFYYGTSMKEYNFIVKYKQNNQNQKMELRYDGGGLSFEEACSKGSNQVIEEAFKIINNR